MTEALTKHPCPGCLTAMLVTQQVSRTVFTCPNDGCRLTDMFVIGAVEAAAPLFERTQRTDPLKVVSDVKEIRTELKMQDGSTVEWTARTSRVDLSPQDVSSNWDLPACPYCERKPEIGPQGVRCSTMSRPGCLLLWVGPKRWVTLVSENSGKVS